MLIINYFGIDLLHFMHSLQLYIIYATDFKDQKNNIDYSNKNK